MKLESDSFNIEGYASYAESSKISSCRTQKFMRAISAIHISRMR